MKTAVKIFLLLLIISAFTTAVPQVRDDCTPNGGVCEAFYSGSRCRSGVDLHYTCRPGAICCLPSAPVPVPAPAPADVDCRSIGGVCESFFWGSLCKSGVSLRSGNCHGLGAMCCKPPTYGFQTQCARFGGLCREDVNPKICEHGRMPYSCFGPGTVCCSAPAIAEPL